MRIIASLSTFTKADGTVVQPIRTDSSAKKRTFANVRDTETGQYLTLYAKLDSDKDRTILRSLSAGQTFSADVTAHPLGTGSKLVASNIKVIKAKKAK